MCVFPLSSLLFTVITRLNSLYSSLLLYSRSLYSSFFFVSCLCLYLGAVVCIYIARVEIPAWEVDVHAAQPVLQPPSRLVVKCAPGRPCWTDLVVPSEGWKLDEWMTSLLSIVTLILTLRCSYYLTFLLSNRSYSFNISATKHTHTHFDTVLSWVQLSWVELGV